MNKNTCPGASINPPVLRSEITVEDALQKYWRQLSLGWNPETTKIYREIYQHMFESIRDIPVSRVNMHEHIKPIVAQYARYEHLLRRFFWTVAAGEGYCNPFSTTSK